jgi:glycine/D-amino acid oxidase-like deaminating enzyme
MLESKEELILYKNGKAQSTGRIQSLWLATTPDTDYASLSGNISVDVAVLGGGIVGITSALLLAEAGLKVALVEANRIARGISGHTAGKITSLHQLIYSYLISKYGTDKARTYAEANQVGIETIASRIKKEDISCDFIRKSAYTYAESLQDRALVEDEVKAAQSLNLPASFVESIPLPFETRGAICMANQAQFNPRKYLLNLAGLIITNRGQIFESTRALNIEEGEPCLVTTDRGTIKAKEIVISSHFPFYDINGFYKAHLFPMRTYMIAIRSADQFPDGIFIGSDDFGHSLRSQKDGQTDLILIGGEDHPVEQVDGVNHHRELVKFAQKYYRSSTVEYLWAGQYNNTVDRVPYIGKFSQDSKHLFVATGFGGWGMAHGTAAGIIFRDLILRRPNPWASFYDASRIG